MQSLNVTITVSGSPAPTGAVVLSGGGFSSAPAALNNGSAILTIPAGSLALGNDTLTASYTPDNGSSSMYSTASGASQQVAVAKITPTVTVTPSSTSITTLQSLNVTIAVSGSPAPTGSVTLIGGGYTSAGTILSNGNASITIPAGSLAAGNDTLTASYTPDSASSTEYSTAAGTSPQVAVAMITPTVTVTPSSSGITTAQSLTVTITLAGSGNATPTGSVTLTSGSYISVATALSSGRASINIPAGSLTVGNDTLTASYTPDNGSSSTYNSATGTSPQVTVAKIMPVVTVTPASSSITTAQSLTVAITVGGGSGNATPTGSVTLTSGTYTSAATALSSGSASINIPAGSLTVGNDTLTASYTPDNVSSPIYNSATGPAQVTVSIPPNLVPTISSMSPAYTSAGGTAFTLTISGTGFVSGSTAYWGTTALTTQSTSATQLTATVTAGMIASAGQTAITVQSPAPGGGTSNAMQFEVDTAGTGTSTAPVFTQAAVSVAGGSAANYPVTLPSSTSNVSVTCVNLPVGATCSYSSSSGAVTISTSSTTPKGTYQVTVVFTETLAGAASSFVMLPVLLLPLLFFRRKMSGRGIWFASCLGLAFLAGTFVAVGCGGAGGSTPVTPPSPTHEVSSSGAVTLTVQ